MKASLAVLAHKTHNLFNLLVAELLLLFDKFNVDWFHHLLGLRTLVYFHLNALNWTTSYEVEDFWGRQVLLFEVLVGFFDLVISDFVAAVSEHFKHGLACAVEDAFVGKLVYHFIY